MTQGLPRLHTGPWFRSNLERTRYQVERCSTQSAHFPCGARREEFTLKRKLNMSQGRLDNSRRPSSHSHTRAREPGCPGGSPDLATASVYGVAQQLFHGMPPNLSAPWCRYTLSVRHQPRVGARELGEPLARVFHASLCGKVRWMAAPDLRLGSGKTSRVESVSSQAKS